MRWHDERINHEVATLHPDLVHDLVLIDLLRRMRDDYERALLDQRSESIRLAQQMESIAELEVACEMGRETIAAKDAHIAELEQQLADALITIEHEYEVASGSTGLLYAEGCAP